jgi:hypothetical protein
MAFYVGGLGNSISSSIIQKEKYYAYKGETT